MYEISIMMKLGNDLEVKVDGNETMKIYKDFCDKNGSVWFFNKLPSEWYR